MLDGMSLDQVRTFIAAAEEGSFSAAARRLRRAQSVVSQSISNLEAQLGTVLFDRSGRYPALTGQGRALLGDARSVAAGIDAMKARAKGMAEGLEPELSVVVDVMFPMQALIAAAKAFAVRFPRTPLRLRVEALGAAFEPVLDGRCGLGIVGATALTPAALVSEPIGSVTLVMVAGRDHPLAGKRGVISKAEAAQHTQMVLTDRSDLTAGHDFGVFSPSTWRLADMGAKHAFIRNGVGWGGMPWLAIQAEVASGELVVLEIEGVPPGGLVMPMAAFYRPDAPPGPAGRWLIGQLEQCGDRLAGPALRA